MKPIRGYIESCTNYEPGHTLAQENCPICGRMLGYDTPLLSYSSDYTIHSCCEGIDDTELYDLCDD
jgi:hypothetical protein